MVKGKYLNFILSCVRRARSQIIAAGILFVVASALLNIFFFLSFDYTQNYYREKERLNGADADVVCSDIFANEKTKEKLAETVSGINGVADFEIDEISVGMISFSFKDSKITDVTSLLRYDDAVNKRISRYEIIESDGGSGAYLGYYFKTDGGYSVGDTITLTYGSREATFRVAGFYNNVCTGSINCSDIAVLLTEDCMTEENLIGTVGYKVSVITDEDRNPDLMESVIAEEIGKKLPTILVETSSSTIKLASARYVTASIITAVICVGAFLMVAVVLIVIAVTLSNYIHNNTKSLGTLKAQGYSSSNLVVPIVIEFSVIGFITSAVGTALSYFVFPILNTAMERQVAIPYQIRFLPFAAVLSVGICTALAALTSFLSVIRIHAIAPINAIRDNKTDKSGKRNFFALEKTRLGLNTAIALKTWISATARNLVIFFSMAGVAFMFGFSCFTFQNVILDMDYAVELICGVMTDSSVAVFAPFEDSFCDKLGSYPEVERYYMFSRNMVMPKEKSKLNLYVIDSAECVKEEQICVKGHLPVSDNEIAVNGTYSATNGVTVGDIITFETDSGEVEYVISGINQGACYAGRDGYITRDGYLRMSQLTTVTYYIDLKDGTDIDGFNKKLSEECNLIYSYNYRENMDTLSRSYGQALMMSTVVLTVLGFVITGFVLYILISIFLTNKKREHGILKSLGFVTGDIVYQTVLSIMPTCTIAAALGLWLSREGVLRLLSLAVNSVGIFSFGSPTKVIYLVAAGIIILGFTVVYSTILSHSVKKITPHKLFINE